MQHLNNPSILTQIGNYGSCQVAIDEVLTNAKTNDDKLQAHLHYVKCRREESEDYSQGVDDGVKVLHLYGFDIPLAPTKTCVAKEEMKLKVALRGKSYSCLTNLPIADVPVIAIFSCVVRFALVASREKIMRILVWRAIQCMLKCGVDRRFPRIMALYAGLLAKEGKVKTANEIGNITVALCEKVGDDHEAISMAHATVLCQLQPFRNGMERYHTSYKDCKLRGEVETTLGSMLGYSQTYIAAGLELGPLFESKMMVVEEFSRTIDRPGFLLSFQICRQFALNLRKRCDKPTEFLGEAFNEKEELSKLAGNAHKMALRDSSTLRLQLAFIFCDEDTMVEMLTILKDYPLTDQMIARGHIRLCFTGLAAIAVGRTVDPQPFQKLGQNVSLTAISILLPR